ncbi:MAG: efflux RND transporter periplasmic adaptor subunit [Myxococcota bacterium]
MTPTQPPGGRGTSHLRVAGPPKPQIQATTIFAYDIHEGTFLVVTEGPLAGKQVPLLKKVTSIGRSAGADIVLPDVEVSSIHAEIVRAGGSFTLRDAGSRNGVEFRGQLIDEVPLADGDQFSICRTRFRFVSKTEAPDTDALESEEDTQVGPAPEQPQAHRPWLPIAAVATPLVLGVLWAVFAGGDVPRVTVATARRQPLKQTTSFSGRLVPRSEVRLFASVSAPVIELLATEGQRVKKGDPIIALDPEILGMAFDRAKAQLSASQAAVRAADAALRQAERKHREDRTLARKGILSRAEVDAASSVVNARRSDRSSARAKLRLAETGLAQARRDHKDTVVRAPIAGQVTTINIKVGESPQDLRGVPVATIEDASELLAEISASEAKVGLLRTGQAATLRITGIGLGVELSGKVVQIAPKAQQPMHEGAATIYTAKVALNKRDQRLRPGMQAHVRIVTAAKKSALTVPLSAMVTGGRTASGVAERVAVVDPRDSTIHWVGVETDLIATEDVEVISGLKEGELVVTGPVDVLLKLKDGDLVDIVDSVKRR